MSGPCLPSCLYIEVEAWRNTATFVEKWFKKGSAITVEGSLRNNNYTDNNGVKHYGYVVSADNVGFGGGKNDSSQSGTEQSSAEQSGTSQTDIEQFAKDVTVEPLPSEEVPF